MTATAELAPIETRAISRPSDDEWSVERIVEQTRKIQECMKAVMIRDEHYGVIPGTGGRDGKPPKPTLLKPGAEKLCLMFRLCPEYETMKAEQSAAFISYTIRCRLVHIPSGNLVATGLGSCNSREKKYSRPGERKCPACGKETIIKGKDEYGGGWLCFAKKGGCNAKYKDGDATIEKQDTGVADPSDLDNTLLKMACKRALIAAVLNGTAASDCFTQDLEDLQEKAAEYIPPPATVQAAREALNDRPTPPAPFSPAAYAARNDSPHEHAYDKKTGRCDCGEYRNASFVPATGGPITPEQTKAIHALLGQLGGVTDEAYRKGVAVYRQANGDRCVDSDGKGTSQLLSRDQASHLIDRFERQVRKQGARAARGLEPDASPAIPDNVPEVPTLGGLMDKHFPFDGKHEEEGETWLYSLFGVRHPQELDKGQGETAVWLLMAYGTDEYDKRETTARAMGKVR